MACWVPSCYAVSAYVFTAWLKQKERKYSHIFFLFFCLILTEVSSDLFFLFFCGWSFDCVSTAAVSLGGPQEDQCVVLGLGGHDPLYQQQPTLAAWWAKRLWFLCIPGGTASVGSESQPLHRKCPWSHLWKGYRWVYSMMVSDWVCHRFSMKLGILAFSAEGCFWQDEEKKKYIKTMTKEIYCRKRSILTLTQHIIYM